MRRKGQALYRQGILVLVAMLCSPVAWADKPDDTPDTDEDRERDSRGSFSIGGEVIGGWQAQWAPGDTFNGWDLDQIALNFHWRPTPQIGLIVIPEVVRSGGPRGFFGVDGDSLVVRLKQGWGRVVFEGPVRFEARAGLVPDVWVESLEADYGLRGMAPTLSERGQFFDTSDMGGVILSELFEGRLRLALALTNGEGRASREQNRGKNLTGLVAGDVWRFDNGRGRLRFHGGVRDGSTGVASAANHRLSAGITLDVARAGIGVEGVYARGYGGRGDREASGMGAWGWAAPWETLPGLALRWDRLELERSLDEAHQTEVYGALFYDFSRRLSSDERFRIYLTYGHRNVGMWASPLPGVPEVGTEQRLGVMLEVGTSYLWE